MNTQTLKNGDTAAYRCPQRNSWLDGRTGTVSDFEGEFCTFKTKSHGTNYRVLVSHLEPVAANE